MPDDNEIDDLPARPTRRANNKAMAAGYSLVGGLLVGLGLGWAIDVWRGTSPAWTVACAVVFLLIGLYQVVKDALR